MRHSHRIACIRIAILLLLPLGSGPVSAQSLAHYLESALRHDFELRAAGAQRDATREQRSQGLAQILPQISYQASRSKNATETTVQSAGRSVPQELEYPSETKSIQLRQPILRPRLVFNAFQGGVKAAVGDLQYELSRQQTIARASGAYLSLRYQLENVNAAGVENASAQLRLRYFEGMRAAGQASDVELGAARSAALLAVARQREAEALRADAQRELADITALPAALRSDAVDWLQFGRRLLERLDKAGVPAEEPDIAAHPVVASQAKTLESVKLELRKARSEHAPTLDFVAGISESNSALDIAIDRQTRTRAVGFQLNVPIFSGGMTQSLVREQAALVEKASFNLDAARSRVTRDRARTREALASRREILAAAVSDAEAMILLERQADRGQLAGIRSRVDVAEARARKQRAYAHLAEAATNAYRARVEYEAALGSLDAGIAHLWDGAWLGASL